MANRTYILRIGTHYNDGIHYCGREARTLTRTIPVLNAMIANDCKAKSEDMINRCVEEVHDNEGTWAVSGSKEGSVHTVNLNTATCTCYSNRSTQIPCKHIFYVLEKHEKKCFDDLVPIIDKQTPHLTLDYDVIEQGKQVPRKSQGSVSLSLPLSTMSENRPMSENSLSSHVHDCSDWEMCSEAGQGGTQQGHDECLEDTCDLENDCQSDNEDCNGDDNFANKLGNINIREIIGNLKAVMDTLYHWQDTKEKDPNYVLTKDDRAFLNGANSFLQTLSATSSSPRVPKHRTRQLQQAKKNEDHRMTSKGKKAAKKRPAQDLFGGQTHRKGNMATKQKNSPLKRHRTRSAPSQTQPSYTTDLEATRAT